MQADDLFSTPLDQAQIDFENEGGETYICGNPPYSGYNKQAKSQKEDLEYVFKSLIKNWGNLDYVLAWFAKAALFLKETPGASALVATNSICQGGQVSVFWPLIDKLGAHIHFAYHSFKWRNLASNNAGITVVIVGFSTQAVKSAKLFDIDGEETSVRDVPQINGYLISGPSIYVSKEARPISDVARMSFGNHPYYAADLIMTIADARKLVATDARAERFLRPIFGSTEVIRGVPRMCLWIDDASLAEANSISGIKQRIDSVRKVRKGVTNDGTAQALVDSPHRFRDVFSAQSSFIAVPQTTSENRQYLPCALMDNRAIVTFKCFALYDAPLWNMALVASRLHITWIGAVCGRMRTDFSYSNTLGWNTFPVPMLTDKNKADLTRCAEDILLAREHHYPATIADLYDSETMPNDLRAAHDRNDEVLERIYIGRRFKNDTERLERLFDLYTKMTASLPAAAMRKHGGSV